MIFEDLDEKDESVTQWISDEAVWRTAPATTGLLKVEQIEVYDIELHCNSKNI